MLFAITIIDCQLSIDQKRKGTSIIKKNIKE